MPCGQFARGLRSLSLRAETFRVFACACLALALAASARGDVPVPPSVLNPGTAEEAWNVIGLATKNAERLAAEARLAEIPQQISLCSPALRTLARVTNQQREAVATETAASGAWVIAIAQSAKEGNGTQTQDGLRGLRGSLGALANYYDSKTVHAAVYSCPMHPDGVALTNSAPCSKCAMPLLERRIPYSFIYSQPGQPTIQLTATADGPCQAGRQVQVKVKLQRPDGAPVQPAELLLMHTERIHLLIQTPTLTDYHHEHPAPTATPGEYAFTFTPAETGRYRIFADLVPAATGLQELPYTDLPGPAKPAEVPDRETRYTSTVGGYQFTLTLAEGVMPAAPGEPAKACNCCLTGTLRAGMARKMHIAVADASGQPVQNLEPVMNAFAHLVGFYDDFQTVVHLHPSGGEILNPAARGGPSMGFQFFPPKAGFVRLYCQVKINDEMLFAPFNLNIAP